MSYVTKNCFKIVAIGDCAVGKTCLLYSFAKGNFPEEYIPTVFDNYQKEMKYRNSTTYTLELWDTAGIEEYKNLRTIAYDRAECFLLCFSMVDRRSFLNAKETWFEDLEKEGIVEKKIPIFLIGTKSDLSTDPEYLRKLEEGETFDTSGKGKEWFRPVTNEEIIEMADRIGALHYFNTSAKLNENVEHTFEKILEFLADVEEKKSMSRKQKLRKWKEERKESMIQKRKNSDGKKKKAKGIKRLFNWKASTDDVNEFVDEMKFHLNYRE